MDLIRAPMLTLYFSISILLMAFPTGSIPWAIADDRTYIDVKPVPLDAEPWGGISPLLKVNGIDRNTHSAVSHLMDEVDRGNLYDYVERLQGFGSRVYRAPGMYEASDWLHSLLLENGNFSAIYHNFTLDRGSLGVFTVSNIILTLPGRNQTSDRVFYMFAHDDAVQSNDQAALLTNTPGADDDASGCAAVIETARVLGRYEFQDTIKFAFFNAEELGLYGSYYWAKNLSESGENVAGFIDYDMIGFSRGIYQYDLDLYYNPASASLANYVIDLNSRYGIGLSILPYQTTGWIPSDIQSFYDFSYPGVMGIEEDFNPYYHKTTDTIDKLNFTLVERSTRLSTAALAEWARLLFVDVSIPPGGLNVSNGDAPEGGLVNLSVNVNNSGNLGADDLEVVFYCDGEPFASRILDVEGNSSETTWAHWTAVTGNHNLSVRLDPKNNIVETDDSNNEAFILIGINDVPKAVLTASRTTVMTYDEIMLNATLSSDVVFGIMDYHFDLGDGNTTGWTSQPTFSYSYPQDSTYTVSLRVRDVKGVESAVASVDIEVLNRAPSASPSSNVSRARTYTPIQFTSNASDIDGEMMLSWDFGDGTVSDDMDPIHTYLKSGPFDVSLGITDDDGAQGSYWLKVIIDDRDPSCSINASGKEGNISTEFKLRSEAFDLDGEIAAHSWDLGDGTTSTGSTVIHRFLHPGNYTVNLEVLDDKGNRAFDSMVLSVHDLPPVAKAKAYPMEVLTGTDVHFDASGSDDLEGPLIYLWDFGDGNGSMGSFVAHAYSAPGTFMPRLIVTDTAGQQTFVELPEVKVRNRLPEAMAMVLGKLERNSTIYFDASLSVDPEGPLVHSWDFGDGSFGEGVFVEHTYNASGNFTLNLTVTDAYGASASYQRVLRIKEPPAVPVQPPADDDDDDDDDDIVPDDDSDDGGGDELLYILAAFNILWIVVVIVLLFILIRSRRKQEPEEETEWE